ncbi:hypothetical protein ACFTXJ_18505 [Streptomyces zhihengii]|uniref:hypothetical protein n=1 Tax=Streptomyces zhihengii TaxID=1818004 RepID=UPI00362737B3
MERADILGGIAASGTDTTARRVTERAAELDIPVADLLAVAGHPVPADLLPPERDAEAVRAFAYRASHCDHPQLAALEAFVRSLPRDAAAETGTRLPWPGPRPARTGCSAVLGELIRNRGFGIRELPFLGLSRSTLNMMVERWEPNPHRRQQLSAIAGPLGWTLPDLFAVAGEPYGEGIRPMVHCHHLGRVLAAAVPLTTAQLVDAAAEADRLSARPDQGVWQPVSQGFADGCPDLTGGGGDA